MANSTLREEIRSILYNYEAWETEMQENKLLSLIKQRAKVWVGKDAEYKDDDIVKAIKGNRADAWKLRNLKIHGYNQRAKEILKRIEKDIKL